MDGTLMNTTAENEREIKTEQAERENGLAENEQAEDTQTEEPVCKGCSASVRLSPEEIKKLFGETLRIRDVKTVSEEEYQRRLALCRSCDSLQYGTTCIHCGCIVEIRAKLAASHCPYPYNPRW
jgi:hypothetical protein